MSPERSDRQNEDGAERKREPVSASPETAESRLAPTEMRNLAATRERSFWTDARKAVRNAADAMGVSVPTDSMLRVAAIAAGLTAGTELALAPSVAHASEESAAASSRDGVLLSNGYEFRAGKESLPSETAKYLEKFFGEQHGSVRVVCSSANENPGEVRMFGGAFSKQRKLEADCSIGTIEFHRTFESTEEERARWVTEGWLNTGSIDPNRPTAKAYVRMGHDRFGNDLNLVRVVDGNTTDEVVNATLSPHVSDPRDTGGLMSYADVNVDGTLFDAPDLRMFSDRFLEPSGTIGDIPVYVSGIPVTDAEDLISQYGDDIERGITNGADLFGLRPEHIVGAIVIRDQGTYRQAYMAANTGTMTFTSEILRSDILSSVSKGETAEEIAEHEFFHGVSSLLGMEDNAPTDVLFAEDEVLEEFSERHFSNVPLGHASDYVNDVPAELYASFLNGLDDPDWELHAKRLSPEALSIMDGLFKQMEQIPLKIILSDVNIFGSEDAPVYTLAEKRHAWVRTELSSRSQ